jgi:hypothetical protein
MASTSLDQPRSVALERERVKPPLQKALVLVAVVVPFVATAYAGVQLWERALSWRDLFLLVGL